MFFSLDRLEDSAIARIIMIFGQFVACLFPVFAYFNVPLVAIYRHSCVLLHSFLINLYNADALLESFDVWLKATPALYNVIKPCQRYLVNSLQSCIDGDWRVLFSLLVVVFCSVVFSNLWALFATNCCSRKSNFFQWLKREVKISTTTTSQPMVTPLHPKPMQPEIFPPNCFLFYGLLFLVVIAAYSFDNQVSKKN